MWRDTELALLDRLLAAVGDPMSVVDRRTTTLDTRRYTDPDAFEQERARLFRGRPHPVAHLSEIAEPGQFVTTTVGGVPLVVARDRAGAVQVVVNACRHRGAPVTREACGTAKAFVCPYHGWSYHLDGRLLHVPQRDCFGDADLDTLRLTPVPFTARHGLVWVQLDADDAPDVEGFLGTTLDADLGGFAVADHVVARRSTHTRAANWKLVVDAFAEGYHLKALHRTSVARYFLDVALCDDLSPHVRQCGARKSIAALRNADRSTWDFRANTTLFYSVFPAIVVVQHPDWISMLTMEPESVDRVRLTHRGLRNVDASTETDARFQRSFDLIDGQVFAQEDFAIAEELQRTLSAGLLETMQLGGLEHGMRLFHAARDAALAG